MKLSINHDYTRFARAGAVLRAAEVDTGVEAAGTITIPHDDRHLRRKALMLSTGERIFVDLPEPVTLETGDRLVLDDGRQAEIVAAEEELYAIAARDPVHLSELAWHIGNRHLAAAIEPGRILILRDHVIKAMLEGLGATVTDTVEPFEPVRGAYSGHSHAHDHGSHGHGSHGPGERDPYGRLPDDPHYGHNHD
jgi:urease accessory protein